MSISTCHLDNFDRSSWKSRPFIMKILTVHLEKLDLSSWNSRSFIMKLWTVHHENLHRLSRKPRPFIQKISTVHHENLDRSSRNFRSFIMKPSTAHNKNSTLRKKISTAHPANKSQLLAKMAFHTEMIAHKVWHTWNIHCRRKNTLVVSDQYWFHSLWAIF